MTAKIDIYPNRKKYYANTEKGFSEAKVTPRNRELVLSFIKYLKGTNTGEDRRAKLLGQLNILCQILSELGLEKNLDELNKDDILSVVGHIEDLDRSESTKADYRRLIKQFYKWLRDEDPRLDKGSKEAKLFYKYVETELRRGDPRSQVDPSEVITDEDMEKILEKGCKNNRDRALVQTLHETGLRVGEILPIQIKDLDFKDSHLSISVDGKTGRRTVMLLKAMPDIMNYLASHPYKDDPEAILFINLSNSCKTPYKHLVHQSVWKITRDILTRAGINKKKNPHWLRHSSVSMKSTEWTDRVMENYYGWSRGSKQPSRYSHLRAK